MGVPFRTFARTFAPFGLVEWRRSRIYSRGLRKYGIVGNSRRIVASAASARFDLWPEALRQRPALWTLVDVGANEGQFLAAVRELVAPARVFAFEPLPQCQPMLQREVAQYPNGSVFQLVIDESRGRREFLRTADSKFSSALEPSRGVDTMYGGSDVRVIERIEARSETLDDALQDLSDEIGLLKIDVQGMEARVLRGATGTLRKTNAVLIEVNYQRHYEGAAGYRETFDLLHANGFELHGISCPFQGAGGPLWADALFAKRSNR